MYNLKRELKEIQIKEILLTEIVMIDFKTLIGEEMLFANCLLDFVNYGNHLYHLKDFDETAELMFYADTTSWRYAIPVEIFETLKL